MLNELGWGDCGGKVMQESTFLLQFGLQISLVCFYASHVSVGQSGPTLWSICSWSCSSHLFWHKWSFHIDISTTLLVLSNHQSMFHVITNDKNKQFSVVDTDFWAPLRTFQFCSVAKLYLHNRHVRTPDMYTNTHTVHKTGHFVSPLIQAVQ